MTHSLFSSSFSISHSLFSFSSYHQKCISVHNLIITLQYLNGQTVLPHSLIHIHSHGFRSSDSKWNRFDFSTGSWIPGIDFWPFAKSLSPLVGFFSLSPRPGFSPPPCPESRRWRDRKAPLSLLPPPEVVGQRKPDQSPTLRSPTPSGITPTRTDKTPAPINPKMASPLVSAERPIRLANSL
jgi:hypothetical protein